MIYKVQWPLYSTGEPPMILIYPDARPGEHIYLPATKEERERLFQGKFIRVYFQGRMDGEQMVVEKFVRKEEWL